MSSESDENIEFGRIRQRIPFREQSERHLAHDGRIADDTAGIECRRHDAAMAMPNLALAGQETAPESGLQQAAADLGFDVVPGIIQEHMPDRSRLIEDKCAAPQQPLRDDVLVEVVRPVSGQRILADDTQELPKSRATLRPERRGKDRGLAGLNSAHSDLPGLFPKRHSKGAGHVSCLLSRMCASSKTNRPSFTDTRKL
jgi:hypothetical protein